MKKKKTTNPFYVLLLLAGIAFAITASAYGVMTVRQLNQGRMSRRTPMEQVASGEDFNQLVDRYGPVALVVELVLLGIGTFGAIAYDQRLDAIDAAAANDTDDTPATDP